MSRQVLLLHTGEKAIRQRYAAKVQAAGYSAAEKEELINTRLQQYQRHVISIAELFKNVIRQIEVSTTDDDQGAVYEVMKSSLHVRAYSNAPLRSHRISIIGPLASGRTSQCKIISKHYGLIHVDLAQLLRKHQRATGQQAEDIPPEHVGDEELCSLVGKRLNEIDCMRKGWVLDGFPKTQSQAEFLRQSHLWPTRLITLKMHEEVVLNRLANRKVDPLTGIAYYKTPTSVAVQQRLVQAEYDIPEKARARYKLHSENADKVAQSYPLVSFSIRGEGDIPVVTAAIQEAIDKPLSSELAQSGQSDEA